MADVGLVAMLIVRLYAVGVLTGEEQAVAVATATEILAAAGIPTTWPPCAIACATPLAAGEVAIRIVRSPAPYDAGDLALGYSLIDRRARQGALATIYLDRVERIAANAAVGPSTVLGRAIAHEIGHLLLGTSEHAEAGVMRPVWTRLALKANNPADWHFTPADVTALRHGLTRRTPAGMRAVNDTAVVNLESGEQPSD